MCGVPKEFIKESGCSHNTNIWTHSMVQWFLQYCTKCLAQTNSKSCRQSYLLVLLTEKNQLNLIQIHVLKYYSCPCCSFMPRIKVQPTLNFWTGKEPGLFNKWHLVSHPIFFKLFFLLPYNFFQMFLLPPICFVYFFLLHLYHWSLLPIFFGHFFLFPKLIPPHTP